MSAFTTISDLSVELRRRVHGALRSAPGVAMGTADPDADVTLFPPGHDDLPDSALVSLFLYHVAPDGHLRNLPRLPVGAGALRFPPLTLQLLYLVTPLDVPPNDHLALGRILQHFHDTPVVDSVGGVPVGTSGGAASPAFRVTLEVLSVDELARVWNALNASYRLSVAYRVRVLAVDSARETEPAHRVTESLVAVGHKDPVAP